jgi:hypothetical protein
MALTNGNGWLFQRGFNPQDHVPYRTMRTVANHILKDCLVPITAWLGNIFDSIRKTCAQEHRVRAVDMLNVLLLLFFLLHNLLEEEVEGYNRSNPFDPICDPADECIQMVLLLLEWYHL